MDPLSILHIRTWLNAEGDVRVNTTLFCFFKGLWKEFKTSVCFSSPDDITQSDPQIVADHPVHANLFIGAGVVRQHNAHSLPPLLTLHQHCVSTEELQLVHLGLKRY